MRKYLDPALIAQLHRLELKARLVVEGSLSGMHKSPYRGFSVEFAEHKSYFPGDDIRYIDWKLYGKTEKYFIKQYEEDTNLKGYIVLDTSASMGFGKDKLSKFDYAGKIAVALSYLMLSQRDSVGLLAFNNDIVKYVPPRNNMIHLQNIISVIDNLNTRYDTGICKAFQYLASRIRRRGLIVLISDLIDDQGKVLNYLRYLRHMKHELIILHVVHPDELELPYHGTVRFKNMEYSDTLMAAPDRIRKDYQSKIQSFIDTYRAGCWQEHIDYGIVRVDEPVEKAVLDIIARRKKR